MSVTGHIACLISRFRSMSGLSRPRRLVGKGAHYYPYLFSPPPPRRRLPRGLTKGRGRVLRVWSCSVGVNACTELRCFGHRSTTIPSSYGGAAPADSGGVRTPCFNVDSTTMTCRLVEVRKHYYILSEYEFQVPLPEERPYDAFTSGFSLSTDAVETGLKFLLHLVIEACLERRQISPS
ncbi:hypothetical protein BHM03_00039355 [Ensete ventricosum]|nr:hypothetical protein BHM03_00039355 [Ensete ventricosum]